MRLPFAGFYWRARSRSYQGHFKVKSAIILNKNIFLLFPYVFFLQRSVPQGCSCHIVAGKPSNTHPRWYSDYMWLGGVIPHSYITRPFLSHPVPTLTSVQNEVNWSLVEHMGFKSQNTLGTHSWVIKVTWFGVALYSGFDTRVRTMSYKGHFKGKADKLLDRNTFVISFHGFSGYWWPYCFGLSDDIKT